MTIKECIDGVDNIKPNQYSIRDKVLWLSFIDEIIINDMLKTHEGYDGRYDDFVGYSEDKLSMPLIVPSPYDRLYTAYLKMKIDGENGETARYNNSAAMFNTYMMEYRKYYNKTHMPLNKGHKNKTIPPKPFKDGLTEAEFENLKKELYYLLSDDFAEMTSNDKLYAIVTNYMNTNAAMLKGKDGLNGVDGKNGYTPRKGVDYFTDEDIAGLNIPSVDQTYSPGSENAQSGKAVAEAVSDKQDSLVSGTNIKTINNQSILGSGNITIEGGSDVEVDQIYNPESENAQSGKAVAEAVATEQNRADNTFANALKGSKSGSAILIDDVSPVTHEMGVKIRGKNLIPYPYFNTTITNNGITFTDNGDGTITANGTATDTAFFVLNPKLTLPKDTYCVSDSLNRDDAYVRFDFYKGSFTIDETTASCEIRINNGATLNNVLFKPQLEPGTTSTSYTPYVPDLTAVKVSRCGKNLFDKSIPYGDYTFSGRGYNYLSIYVGSGSNVTVSLKQKRDIGLGGYFFCVAYKANTNIFPLDSHMKWLYYSTNTAFCQKSVTMISEDGYVSLFMNPSAYDSFKDEIMVEIGSNATEYESYIEPQIISLNTDGTVEGVTSLYPNTTLLTDTEGVIIECEYNKDINKAFAALEAAIATNNS